MLSTTYTTTQFMDKIKPAIASFGLSYGQEYSGQGSGILRVKDLRPPLWTMDITTVTMYHDTTQQILAIMEGMDGSIQTFMAYNPYRRYPLAGKFSEGSGLKVTAISTDFTSIKLNQLPAHYQINIGDMVSWNYGSSPQRHALHRFVEAGVATSTGGTTKFLQIKPAIRPGLSTGQFIHMSPSFVMMRILPGSVVTSNNNNNDTLVTSSITFSAIQVI